MKKKILIIIILLLTIFIGFKGYSYLVFSNVNDHDVSLVFKEKYKVQKTNETEEYLELDGMKFKNAFADYEKMDTQSANTLRYVIKKNDEVTSAVLIGVDDTFVNSILKSEEKEYINLIKKHNIKTDIELLKLFEEYNDSKVKFLMTYSKQKDIHDVKQLMLILLPSVEYAQELDGLDGYVFNSKNIKEYNILHNDKRYYFTFIGEHENTFIQDIINSIEF